LPALFGVLVTSPQAGPAVTAASVTLPNGSRKDLSSLAGFLNYNDEPATESALEAAYPPGPYTVRFTQTGAAERVIPMNMPATPPAIPKISNFTETQAIDAAQDFTLRWIPFSPAGPGAYITLIISDGSGNLVFLAPNFCIPRTLDPTATSIVIPANTFKAGNTYEGTLEFGLNFYNSTNTVPQMSGYGGIMRSTEFSLKTSGGGGTVLPAKFTAHRLLPNGHPELTLTGTASRSYTIRRASTLTNPSWTTVGTVTMNATGSTIFEDTDNTLKLPAFYVAVSN
jgi:hypothetical protein